MHDSIPSYIHFPMHPVIEFSDSISPNIQQHHIVQSQNHNFAEIPSAETISPSQSKLSKTPPSPPAEPISNSDYAEASFSPSADTNSQVPNSASSLILRRSDRIKHKPSYLQDYHCKLVFSCSPQSAANVDNSGKKTYPLSSFISYDNLSSNHKHFCLSISSQPKLKFYHQAVKNSLWCEAMKAEIKTLEENKTWVVTDLPSNKHPIGCK
jgi:hypothetical protein